MFYGRKKGSKYNNIKVEYDGIKFDSKKECERYKELKLLEEAGDISALCTQVKYTLMEKFKAHGKTYRAITYTCDFSYVEYGSNIIYVEDLKSKATAKDKVYQLKKKMMIKHLWELEQETGIQYKFKEVIR